MLQREAPQITIGCYCLEYNVNHAKSLLLVQDYHHSPLSKIRLFARS